MSTKESWPELVDKSGDEAKETIAKERPDVTVEVIPDGSGVTMDFRMDRCRVFVDGSNKVVHPPCLG